MTTLYNNVLKSYINPNKSFYYPLETKTKRTRGSFVNNKVKRKKREQTSKGLRNLLFKSQKYILQDDFLKEVFKIQGKEFPYDSVMPPYDNMWIEYSTDILKKTEIYSKNLERAKAETDNQGFHINLYARTNETKIYLITPYRTNLYAPTIHTDSNVPIKILAPLHCILFSTDIALTDEDYWINHLEVAHILKPKDYSINTDKWMWGEKNYTLMKERKYSILDHVAIRPSTFGFFYDAPCYLPYNQKGLPDSKWSDEKDNHEKHLQGFQNSFDQHKVENRIQFHKTTAILFSILSLMNTVHNIRETKYQGNVLEKSNKNKFYHEFKTLIINPTIKNINDYKQYKRLESHHKNRYHSVRGHWRNYRTGKKVWINHYDRGDETLGIIEKEYKVTRRISNDTRSR